MSIRLMCFIDGTWLYANSRSLSEAAGQDDFTLDFGKLPMVLRDEVLRQLNMPDGDLVRTHLFGSYAQNYAPNLRDDASVGRQQRFFDMLREQFHYEVETYPIDFQGRALRRVDRDPNDPWEPREKCVDIALASTLLYYAALPYAYDVAITVIGDRDFLPVLQHVRRLGKRVAIASIQGSCPREFSDPRDEARVRDIDLIWINDFVDRLARTRTVQQYECQDPTHVGEDRGFWSNYQPRRGEPMFCDACRERHRAGREQIDRDIALLSLNGNGHQVETCAGTILSGRIKTRKIDEFHGYYGFIAADDGYDYYFNRNDVGPEFADDEVVPPLRVRFEVKRARSYEKQGAAQNLQPELEVRAT